MRKSWILMLLGAAITELHAQGQPPPLPPPPVPVENQITEAKRVLGKMLFWDDQVSSNNTISCGGCHQPASGGSDPRIGINPGPDGTQPSQDDIAGSPGVIRADLVGLPVDDPVFGLGVQVTGRSANTYIGAAYAPSVFWDGRALPTFTDPETGLVSIANGGGLESQAVGPILSHSEMARDGRTWSDVRIKLQRALPMSNATDLPQDVRTALASDPTYPELFQAAFNDPAITAERIAHAVATYERTLVPNQTPWDRFVGGDNAAMTPPQVRGWNFFRGSPCAAACHTPPVFSNQTFRNIGIRPPGEDTGRQVVTGLVQDRGKFKVPTLRNAGLKPTHMHNGRIADMNDSVLWYRPNNPQRSPDNLDPALPVGVPPNVLPDLVDFLQNALTDPRVAAQTFPFDRPTVHGGNLQAVAFEPDHATIDWPGLAGVQRYFVYRGDLASLHALGGDGLPAAGYGACASGSDPDTTNTNFADADNPSAGEGFFYLKSVVDGSGAERGLGAASTGQARTVLASCLTQ